MGRVTACVVKATLFHDGACVFSLAPFLKALAAPRDTDLRASAVLARHRPARTVVLERFGHISAEQLSDVQAPNTCSWAEVHGQNPRRSFLPHIRLHRALVLRRSVFALSCSSAHCTVACAMLMSLMIVCFCCQTVCQRFGRSPLPNKLTRAFQSASSPLSQWTAKAQFRDGEAGHMWTEISSGGSRAKSSSGAWVILVSQQLA